MRQGHRRSTPKVIDGRVQRKNRIKPTLRGNGAIVDGIVVDKERPGRGYRHLISPRDIRDFVALVPEWDQLSVGLQKVLLAEGRLGIEGWYNYQGVIAICAWPKDFWKMVSSDHFDGHHELFGRLGVPCEKRRDLYLCKFTRETARAYQLLHVFLHELGHHRDLMTTRRQIEPGRGEPFAEDWAIGTEANIWDAFEHRFGIL